MDWNNDGKKDLITGEHDGFIRIYLNTGTDSDPLFNGYSLLQMNGADYTVGYKSSPFIADFNDDGKKDLLCGEDFGRIALLVNIGTDAAPVFDSAVFIQDGSQDINVGLRSCPVFVDWNVDGKKDLLVGCYEGVIFYFENQGTVTDPLFNGSTFLEAGGSLLDVSFYSRIDVTDWDNDDVLDVVSAGYDFFGMIRSPVWYFHGKGPLAAGGNSLSRTAGGTIEFSLNAGTANGGRNYFLLGSASGTEPGLALPGGGVLPLNRDALFDYILGNHNSPMLDSFRGILDSDGKALATLNAPSVTLAAGSTVHFAYTTESPYDFQSNAVPVEIIP